MPEKVLPCGHALCDVCIKICGSRAIAEKNTFKIKSCVICGASNPSTFSFIPPTAGVRILSLDGGGVKGVIPLVFLQSLEEQMAELRCPLRDHFDLVCGTSSGKLMRERLPAKSLTEDQGGLIILGMFLREWPLHECLSKFEGLARKIFQRRTSGSMLFTRMQELVMSYIADCRYDSTGIEAAFQQAFGPETRMFNPISNDTKVAVTTTTAREAQSCVLSNYNGGKRPDGTSAPRFVV